MKLKLLSFIIVGFIFSIISLYSAEFYDNKIIIKLKANNEKQIVKSELDVFFNNYTLKQFLSKSTLKFLNHKLNTNKTDFQEIQDFGLDRIYLIEFKENFDVNLLASKISHLNGVDYAEPLFKRAIVELPDDSLLFSQYALFTTKAFDAWRILDSLGITDIVKVGVVDTGVDYNHEDLDGKMYINSGEDGFDSNGNDKRTNGIDDDNNGYIDDWRGWDFASDSDTTGMDNDPIPGHGHGTHVSGIIAGVTNNVVGIAGMNPLARIIPVKIGGDSPNSRNLINSYEGLLYASLAGASVINCSWGGSGFSQSEQDIINQAIALGSLIVAAAGNNSSMEAFYPASYKGVISVAASDYNDKKAYFSNYHNTVDVIAPGDGIMSSIPGNEYASWSGTSMASPVAVGVASMIRAVFPKYNNIQVGEHLKATSDNVDSLNPYYLGMIGRGRVNAYRALTERNVYSLNIDNYKIVDANNDGLIESGEKVNIYFELFNVLNALKSVTLTASSSGSIQYQFINNKIDLGDFNEFEHKYPVDFISFNAPTNAPLNYNLPIKIVIESAEGYVYTTVLNVMINPSWRTIDTNNIKTTINSQGNIAYDDYPSNNMGVGFTWKTSSNLLYEGSLMITTDSNKISDVARSSNQSYKNNDFIIDESISKKSPGPSADMETAAIFSDNNDSLRANVKVINKFFQYHKDNMDDFIIAQYDVINKSDVFRDSVFVGLYFDWDIGTSGTNNQCIWDYENNFGYVYNTKVDSLPYIGVKILSQHYSNFFAMDNDGTTEDNPGVYDGFTKEEKRKCMINGIARDSSSITDISMIISAGPISMRANDTNRVVFSIFAAKNLDELRKAANNSKTTTSQYLNLDGDFASTPKKTFINNLYPNPASNNKIFAEILHDNTQKLQVSIFDISGRECMTQSLLPTNGLNQPLFPGIKIIGFDLSGFAQGMYYLRVSSDKYNDYRKFTIIR